MRYRKLDAQGDYTLGLQPSTGFHEDTLAVIQAVVTRLNLLLGEWWEDLDEGLPLFEEIMGQYQDLETIELILTERIAETAGVASVENASCQRDEKRRLFYSCEIETIYGERQPFVFPGKGGTSWDM